MVTAQLYSNKVINVFPYAKGFLNFAPGKIWPKNGHFGLVEKGGHIIPHFIPNLYTKCGRWREISKPLHGLK
jgi:hypothetical protein